MKLHSDASSRYSINAYGAGWIEVNREKFSASLVVSAMGHRMDWNCTEYDALQITHFERLAELSPELVLFGSGARIRFPQPQWVEVLYSRGIGLETMDTHAACRAYNFLAGEGRKVVAALLI